MKKGAPVTQLQFTQPSLTKRRVARLRLPYVAEVVHDVECGVWVATCDALHVVTEGASYEAATARFWEIAPEIAADNGIVLDASSRIQFRQVVVAGDRAPLFR